MSAVCVTTALLAGFAVVGLAGSASAPSAHAAGSTLPSWYTPLPDAQGLIDKGRDYEVAFDQNQNPVSVNGWEQTLTAQFTAAASGKNKMLVSQFPNMAIMAGDSMTAHGAIAAGMDSATTALPTGVTLSDVFSLKPGHFGLAVKFDGYDAEIERTSYRPGSDNCATPLNPVLNGTGQVTGTVWNVWCMGVGHFDVVYDPFKASMMGPGYYQMIPVWSAGDIALGLSSQTVTSIGGPSNPVVGAVVDSKPGYLMSVRAGLSMYVEVCAKGTGCDPDDYEGDNSPGQVPNTAGDWVSAIQIPAGSSEIQWRVTVSNGGNVPLEDVHLIASETATDPSTKDAASVKSTECTKDKQFGDLNQMTYRIITAHDGIVSNEPLDWPGVSSISCTTQLDGSLSSELVLGATANGAFPAQMDSYIGSFALNDPNGNPLSARFVGYNGEVGMVPSTQPAFADISVTKAVVTMGPAGPVTPPKPPETRTVTEIATGGTVLASGLPGGASGVVLVVVLGAGMAAGFVARRASRA